MEEKVAFVILCTARYHWLVPPLVHMYEKYMPVPLVFFSDRPIPGQDAVLAFPEGMQIYKEKCGWLAKNALKVLDKPVVFFGYMDLLPIYPVDLSLVGVLAQYLADHTRVARGNLWSQSDNACRGQRVLEKGEGYEIVLLPKDHPQVGQIGCTSLLPSLWRRDFLLEFIEDGWTFDHIEYPGQFKFIKQTWWHSVALLPGQFSSCHLCYTGDPNEVRLSTIPDAEDRAYVAQFVPPGYRVT